MTDTHDTDTGISARLEQARAERDAANAELPQAKRTSRPLTADERANGRKPEAEADPDPDTPDPDPLAEARQALAADRQRRAKACAQEIDKVLAKWNCTMGVTPLYAQAGPGQMQAVQLPVQPQVRALDVG